MSAAEIPQPWQRRPNAGAKLPDYAHPPLVRVKLRVGFSPQPLNPDSEASFQGKLGPDWQLQKRSTDDVTAIVWTTRLGDQQITLLEYGLDYRWNGQAGELYPHYPLVREGFVSVWNAWCDAIASTPAVAKWSVEYVNQIPQGTVWTSLADCSFLRWMTPLPVIEGLSAPEGIGARWRFPLNRFDARLNVNLDSDVEVRNSLKLSLHCYGGIPHPDDTFLAGFDYGREVIVRTFRQLMQPAANEFWGLKA
ncbi:MAG: hypothetical protein SH850_05535 [Planctomycetaceae bacterium]|nr:hypothetical protein [Planctomycetaceae bacterium]